MIIPTKDNARRAPGAVGKASYIGQSNHSLQFCQCRLNFSGCLVCRRWDKAIRGIEARRSDSLRRQALGMLARAGG